MSDPIAEQALQLLARHGQEVETYLREFLDQRAGVPTRLLEAIRYSLMAGGKRLRPALVLECFIACGGTDPARALPSAAALELIHTFSLVHDDLPAMDDDDLRRGRPTNHKVFGEAMAILAGDAMVTLAFEVLAERSPTALVGRLVGELARAAGPAGMIGGQVLDMEGEKVALSLEQLRSVHRLKTGALLVAACRMGAIAAEAPASMVEALTEYARRLGLAFQIIDDVLDVTSTPEQLGKATQKDAGRGKNTYPGLLGLDASMREAETQSRAAVEALKAWGDGADGLRALARFMVQRSS